ncbi:hypothetical protein GE09DRAFT_1154388 [Coniochaeta sp. 2T2.1]|nr:hypothetical protein GE09DRAFT_1154388 [Coniochaeta sp. 2T2.1]
MAVFRDCLVVLLIPQAKVEGAAFPHWELPKPGRGWAMPGNFESHARPTIMHALRLTGSQFVIIATRRVESWLTAENTVSEVYPSRHGMR